MDLFSLTVQALTNILAMLAGAFIYRKGIQGDSPLPQKKQTNKLPKEDWSEI